MRLVVLAFLLAAMPAAAHDTWDNGQNVPANIKAECCGKSDFHRIPPSAIHLMRDGYHIDSLTTVVPEERALPSPDGHYYAFWNENAEPSPAIFCLFVPFSGT